MLAWYCCMVRVINQEAKGLDSNSTLPYVGCVRYHKIVGLDLPNSFNFTSTTSALCECTNSSADLHPSKQPTRSFLKCGGLLHQNFICFRFQCLFLSTAGRKESQRGGEERRLKVEFLSKLPGKLLIFSIVNSRLFLFGISKGCSCHSF